MLRKFYTLNAAANETGQDEDALFQAAMYGQYPLFAKPSGKWVKSGWDRAVLDPIVIDSDALKEIYYREYAYIYSSHADFLDRPIGLVGEDKSPEVIAPVGEYVVLSGYDVWPIKITRENLVMRASDVMDFKHQNIELIETEQPEDRLHGSTRKKMLKLILAMAMDGYGYDPDKEGKNPVTGNGYKSIFQKLDANKKTNGLCPTSEVIKQYLNEAKKLTDKKSEIPSENQ